MLTSNANQILCVFEKSFSILRGEIACATICPINFYKFRELRRALELQLGSILGIALDNCSCLREKIRLLHSLRNLIRRPVINYLIASKMEELVKSFTDEVEHITGAFHTPLIVLNNMPPNAATLTMCHIILQRVREQMELLKDIGGEVLVGVNGQRLVRLFTKLEGQFSDQQRQAINVFNQKVKAVTQEKFSHPVFYTLHPSFIGTSFDQCCKSVLREEKQLAWLKIEIPQCSQKAIDTWRKLRRVAQATESIAQQYNRIHLGLSPVEKTLVTSTLELKNKLCNKYDHKDKQSSSNINWESARLHEFVSTVTVDMKTIETQAFVLKSSLNQIFGL
eukprot:6069003-Ditylum_brightwellii.AAC.1